MKTNKLRLLDKKIKRMRKKLKRKDNKWDYSRPWSEYINHTAPERDKLQDYGRRLRFIKSYKLNELPDFGNVMSLDDFIAHVECGGFIDSDGFGYYVKDGKESDIEIYPSDVLHKMLRADFDTIIWFNK